MVGLGQGVAQVLGPRLVGRCPLAPATDGEKQGTTRWGHALALPGPPEPSSGEAHLPTIATYPPSTAHAPATNANHPQLYTSCDIDLCLVPNVLSYLYFALL